MAVRVYFQQALFVCLCVLVSVRVRGINAGGADIVVLVDSSDSYRSTDFNVEKQFLKAYASKVLENDQNRLGLFTFGRLTDAQFNLNSFNTRPPLLNAIQYLWFSTGDGFPAPAINQTVNEGFSAISGNRECVPNVLVVLSHSAITSADVIRLRRVLEEFVVQLFIIDMTTTTDSSLFVQLTNSSSRVIRLDTFNSLVSAADILTTRINQDLPRTGCGILGTWESWTPCSVTCGSGLKFRIRHCQKVKDSDKDCGVDLTQDATCNRPICMEPENGGWSEWTGWGACSKSCGNGTKTRTRQCDDPIPTNGGKNCVGTDIQTRACSIWSCPDCSRVCPDGGTLSSDCETCICTSVTLYGRAMDISASPITSASIYLKSRLQRAVCTSDDLGYFSVSGVCLMNEEIVIETNGYSTERYTPHAVNKTHWTVNATAVKYIRPLFKIQPHDKLRMVGQSLTLCCEAAGIPAPTTYTWLKDGDELEHQGTNGTLVLNNLQVSDTGTYVCRVETDAGVSRSDDAEIIVDGSRDDTCSTPLSKIETLPNGCYVTASLNKDTTVDIQTCSKSMCMKSSLHDNGTCTDWWPNHCCDVDQFEKVNITCDNYSYETTKVTSCKCTLCVVKTVISGRAFGKRDGKKLPLQLGEVLYNGRFGAKTNMAGYFRFEVEKGIKKAVLTLHDGIFKKFLDATRVLELAEGDEVAINVVLPFKPKAIPFTPSIGSDIEFGGDNDDLPVAGTLSIPGNALIDDDGNPYDGLKGANAHIHFTDPRRVDDLEAANGEFVYHTNDGTAMPLQTYGLFDIGVEDHEGNTLRLNQPISVDFDASVFNFTLDENGEPDIHLWVMDSNKGIWTEPSQMQHGSTSGHGRRRLLRTTISGTIAPSYTPVMDPIRIETSTETVIQRYENYVTGYNNVVSGYQNKQQGQRWVGRTANGNADRWVPNYVRVPVYKDVPVYGQRPVYGDVTIRTPVVKNGACVVSITAYTDFTLKQKAKAGSITVTAFTKQLYGNTYLGKKSDTVDSNGHVCLDVFCDQTVYIYAENGAGERLFPAEHILPLGYPMINNTIREVSFESRNFGKAYDCAGLDPRPEVKNGPCKGPMFPYTDRNVCKRELSDGVFMFKFAPFTGNPIFTSTVGDKNNYDKKLSWYPTSPATNTFRSCFFKLNLKVQDNLDNFDMRVIGVSYLEKNKGDQFGTYNVGPRPDPDSTDTSERGACIEFRCPGYLKDGSNEYFDKSTVLSVNINTANKNLNCSIRETIPGINVVGSPNGMGFEFTAASGNNYGASYGVYISDRQASQVDDACHSGYLFGSKLDGLMKPNKGYAVKMYCNE